MILYKQQFFRFSYFFLYFIKYFFTEQESNALSCWYEYCTYWKSIASVENINSIFLWTIDVITGMTIKFNYAIKGLRYMVNRNKYLEVGHESLHHLSIDIFLLLFLSFSEPLILWNTSLCCLRYVVSS